MDAPTNGNGNGDGNTGRHWKIGVQVGAENSFGRRILEGIIAHAQQTPDWRISWDYHYQQTFWTRRQLDGLIIETRDLARIKRLQQLPYPVVVVSGVTATGLLPLVTTDEEAIVNMAFEHFQQLGLKRIAYVSLEQPSLFQDARGLAFAREAAKHYPPDELHMFRLKEAMTTDVAQVKVLSEWIQTLPKPIGILARRDVASFLLAEACALSGIRVPEDIAILGVDNDPLFCELCNPSLSSIDNGAIQIGRTAAEMLGRMLAGGSREMQPVHVPPVRVVQRQSTDAIVHDDPLISRALRIIRQRSCEGLTVNEILAGVPLSRTMLDIRLRQVIGHTAHQEILRVRLDQAKKLLAETDWKMPVITARCGFSYPSQFSFIFRREFGMQPTEYREMTQHRLAGS